MSAAGVPTVVAQDSTGPSDWDWEFAREILPDIAEGLWWTVRLTVVSMVLAMVLGLVLAILRRSRIRAVSWPVGFVIEFIRSTPLIVQFLFLWLAVPELGITLSSWQAAVFGLGLHYACYTSESYRAGIESVPRGQWEAATAINLSTTATWRQVVLPQAIPTVLPALGNYLVASFKDAPIASVIAVPGIIAAASSIQSQTFRGMEAFTLTGVLFLAVSIPAAMFARYLERRYGYKRD
jgi:polar amino acid transport system permease protein